MTAKRTDVYVLVGPNGFALTATPGGPLWASWAEKFGPYTYDEAKDKAREINARTTK